MHFPFRRLNEDRLYETLFSSGRGSMQKLGGLRRFAGMLHDWLLGTVPSQMEDLEPVLREWKPDVLASDPTVWGPMLVLHEREKLPVAVCCYFCCMVSGPDSPPFGFGLPRPRTFFTRLLARTVSAAANASMAGFRRQANDIRRQYGLPPLTMPVQDFLGTMPLYLVPSAPEFDYQRTDIPPSVHYVGPYLFNKPRHVPAPQWLAELPHDRPWVHATEGTVHLGEAFVLAAAARGLANLPMEVILTTGGEREPSELGLADVAANVRVAKWIAHSDLLPHLDAMITTGGAGTVLAALSAGVPLIVIPNDWDKPELAQRVVEAGAGLRISPRQCTPRRLRAAVERLLGDPSFRRNAQRMAGVFGGYGGAAAAADLIEQLVHSERPAPDVSSRAAHAR